MRITLLAALLLSACILPSGCESYDPAAELAGRRLALQEDLLAMGEDEADSYLEAYTQGYRSGSTRPGYAGRVDLRPATPEEKRVREAWARGLRDASSDQAFTWDERIYGARPVGPRLPQIPGLRGRGSWRGRGIR